jgi:hypothetical protein
VGPVDAEEPNTPSSTKPSFVTTCSRTSILHRNYGWPSGWTPARESLPEFVARSGGRFFQINCSYGIGGWVAANAMDVVAAATTAARPR